MLKEEIVKVLNEGKGKHFTENDLMVELKKNCNVITKAGLRYCLKSLVEEKLIEKQDCINGDVVFFIKSLEKDKNVIVFVSKEEYKRQIFQILSNGGKLTVVDLFCRIHRVYPQGKQCESLFTALSEMVKEGTVTCDMQTQGINAGKFLYKLSDVRLKSPVALVLELLSQAKEDYENCEEE